MSISSRSSRFKLKQSEEEASLLLKLPEEIHDEIFLKLPGRSILASRCVCKFFYNLLSRPNFIRNHLKRKINPRILCFRKSLKNKPPMIYSIPIDYASISSLSCDGAVPINYPFESNKTYRHDILGSCDGLVCLKIESFNRAENGKRGESLHTCYYTILNPLTGEYKDFLGPPSHGSKPWYSDCKITYGFGYDSNLDDYKVLMISDFEEAGCFKIDVYSVKSDSWSRTQGTVNYSFRCDSKRSHGVFFNGSLHWLGFMGSKATQETSSQVIICFDMNNETLVDMPLPGSIIDFQERMHMNVGVWGDCICITCVGGPVRTEVWVMQEYGVKESWIRKYTRRWYRIQLLTCEMIGSLVRYWQPLWCFNNGEILVNNRKELLLYDPTNDKVRSVAVRDIIMGKNRESYVESIVSLDSGTYMEKHTADGIVKSLK